MSDLPRQFGPYVLLKLLAKGGMGEIYLARTQGVSHFEKYYAIKKLLKKFARDQDVGARFIDEAKLGARLQHPNIVQVYDLGALHEELYMATEFVDGFDLRRVLRFCHEKKKRIPLDIALFIVREVLSGLAYAHRQLDADGQSINLIHRDISPQNVLVSFEGEVKIIDFGLAKSTQRSQETQANVLLGNFGYMSPEQARGQKLDVRTDIYSTGIVLFELVTRTKRFVDENPLRLLEMVARPTPVMPSDRAPDIPKRIDTIYAKATNPSKDERYESADQFRQDVTTALHKINPHASREHLAQFLNHLFLGGQAPPSPDTEALDKSVAMQVHELYAQAEAFRRTKEQDAQDRRLSQFSDDAPQTGSHNLMRASRVGDTLSHTELTGEPPLVGVESARERSEEREAGIGDGPDPAEPVERVEPPPPKVERADASPPRAEPPRADAPPAPPPKPQRAVEAPPPDPREAPLAPAPPRPPAPPAPAKALPAKPSSERPPARSPPPERPAERPPSRPVAAAAADEPPTSEVVLGGAIGSSEAQRSAIDWSSSTTPEMHTAPTGVYEAPEWAGRPTSEFPSLPPAEHGVIVDLTSQEQEAEMSLVEANLIDHDLQAQLQAQLEAQLEAQLSAQTQNHDTLQAIPLPEEELLPEGMIVTPGAEAFASSSAWQGEGGDEASLSAPTQPVQRHDPADRPPDPRALKRSGAAVVTTVVGQRPTHDSREQEEPTVVIDMDSMAQPEVTARPPRSAMPPPSGNAFAEGASESLIIDFDVSDMDRDDDEDDEGAYLYDDDEDPDSTLPHRSASGRGVLGDLDDADESDPSGIRPAADGGDPVIRPAATPGRRPTGRPVRDINPRKSKR